MGEKYGDIIKQSAYKKFVSQRDTVGDTIEEERSMQLFNVILSCFGTGHALNTVDKLCGDNTGQEFGHSACKALNNWYIDPTQKDAMISCC